VTFNWVVVAARGVTSVLLGECSGRGNFPQQGTENLKLEAKRVYPELLLNSSTPVRGQNLLPYAGKQ